MHKCVLQHMHFFHVSRVHTFSASDRKNTPSTVRTKLDTDHSGHGINKAAIKAMMHRDRARLRNGKPPHVAIHDALQTPFSSMVAEQVVMWWPPQDPDIDDPADPRARFGVLTVIAGAIDEMRLHNCKIVGLDSAVSHSTTGMMTKSYVGCVPVRATTGKVSGIHPGELVADNEGRIIMEGAPPHHRSINYATMLHNVEVHDFEMLAMVVLRGMIPCSREGCPHTVFTGTFATNPKGWFRRRTECFGHCSYGHLIMWMTDLSSPQLKALYMLSRCLLNAAYTNFTGSGKQWLQYVRHNRMQPRGCVFHGSKAFISWLTDVCGLKEEDVVYAIDFLYRFLCRGPRSFTDLPRYVTAFKAGIKAIVEKSNTPAVKRAALVLKITAHIQQKRLDPYGEPPDDSRARTYMDYGQCRNPSQLELDRAAKLPAIDDPELASWLDPLDKAEAESPLINVSTTDFVEQTFSNQWLTPDGRKRHQDEASSLAFATGHYLDDTRYPGSLPELAARAWLDARSGERASPTRLEVFQEIAALVALLERTWAFPESMVTQHGDTDIIYISTRVSLGSLTDRPAEKREAYSGSPAFKAGRAEIAKLYDADRFDQLAPFKKGWVRGNVCTLDTDSYDCGSKYYYRGSVFTTVLRIVKSKGLPGARDYARFMLPVLVRHSVKTCDILPYLDLTKSNDEVNDQVRALVVAKETFSGAGTSGERRQPQAYDAAVDNLNEDLLPDGYSLDKASSEFVLLGPDGVELKRSRQLPRMTASVRNTRSDPLAPRTGMKRPRVLARTTAAHKTITATNGATASPACKVPQLPVPVPVYAPVQSAKRPDQQRGPYHNLRREGLLLKAAAADAARVKAAAAPSPASAGLTDLIHLALTSVPESDDHYGSTFNSGTNRHLCAPDQDGTFPAVDKDHRRGKRSRPSGKAVGPDPDPEANPEASPIDPAQSGVEDPGRQATCANSNTPTVAASVVSTRPLLS